MPELAFDGEPFTVHIARFARFCRTALEERYSGPKGSMFLLQARSCDGSVSCPFNHAFFTEFDAALRYLEQLETESPEDYAFEGLSYTITKHVPDGKGELKEYCIWALNNTRELWYFDYADDNYPDDWVRLIDYDGASLTLPVPFQPGDIVLADYLPYASPRRVLILDVEDSRDCCCLSALSLGDYHCLFTSTFQSYEFVLYQEGSLVSGLYRAVKWTGELPAEEEPLAILSPLVRANPELGLEIEEYFWRESVEKPWSEVKVAFGL